MYVWPGRSGDGHAGMFCGGKQHPQTWGLLQQDLSQVSSLLACPGPSAEPPHRCGNALLLLHQNLAPALARNGVG